MNIKKLISILGPGLLFAAAAVGVSHLVQSTRAGATYGLDLIPFLVLAFVIKYPFFEFAPRYTRATGKNLIDGYNDIGKWAVAVFLLITITTMFTIVAAVLLVTSGIFEFIFSTGLSVMNVSLIILAVCVLILIVGKYHFLDRFIKIIISLLVISTLVAVVSALGTTQQNISDLVNNFSIFKRVDILFLIAFIGWMPSPLDVSVWHSLWSSEKNSESKHQISVKEVLLDFKIGYIGTAFVALAFILLGALIMKGSSTTLSTKGVEFSAQLINMYTSSIGKWAYPIIATAAFTTMLSTTITVIDAYPRVMEPITKSLFPASRKVSFNTLYWIWMGIVIVGTILLMGILSNSMRFMVDLATTMSFVTAPVVAILNYKAVAQSDFPEAYKPNKGLFLYAKIGIVLLSLFSIMFVIYRFF